MAFHCGAPTRDGSACQRHVRDPGTRCPQHRNLGGPALHPPRYAMRTVNLADPALTEARTVWNRNAWSAARSGLTNRAAELRDRVMWSPEEESDTAAPGTLGGEEAVTTEDETRGWVDGSGGGASGEGGAGRGDGSVREDGSARDGGDIARDEGSAGGEGTARTPVGRRSYLDRERAERARRIQEAADGEQRAEEVSPAAEATTETDADPAAGPEREVDSVHEGAEPDGESTKTVIRLSYLDRERASRTRTAESGESTDPEAAATSPLGRLSYLDREAEADGERDDEPTRVVIRLSYLDRERASRTKTAEPWSTDAENERADDGEFEPDAVAEQRQETAAEAEHEREPAEEVGRETAAEAEHEHEAAGEVARAAAIEAEREAASERVGGPAHLPSYLDRERAVRRLRAQTAADTARGGKAKPERAAVPKQAPEVVSERAAETDLDREAVRALEFAAEPETAAAESGPEAEPAAESELLRGDAETGSEREAEDLAEPEFEPDFETEDLAEPQFEREPKFEREPEFEAEFEPEPEVEAAEFEPESEFEPEDRAEPELEPAPGPEDAAEAEQDAEPEVRAVQQRPLLRKERPLDPDWIGGRPLFRDEAPTRPLPRIEFEPSGDSGDAGGVAPRKRPRIAPMRSVVLGPRADEASQAPVKPVAEPDADPPTLIDRMPPIDPDDLAVPEFLRPDFVVGKSEVKSQQQPDARAPKPQDQPPPQPAAAAAAATAAPAAAPAPPKPSAAEPLADPDPPTLIETRPVEDIAVPDFIVPGFSQPAPKPPLRTVLSTVLGPDLWQRCYAEWGAAHCTALARIARAVDGLAPSATAAMRSTAGVSMRWLGVAREREALADEVADAISHPPGASTANQARTLRLYGAAICTALNLPLRRCACHRDLERDVSGELIRLGLEELAGEVP